MQENSPCLALVIDMSTFNLKATTHMKDALHRFNNYANFGLSAMDSCMKFFFRPLIFTVTPVTPYG
jgi:hypothetical protein